MHIPVGRKQKNQVSTAFDLSTNKVRVKKDFKTIIIIFPKIKVNGLGHIISNIGSCRYS